MRALKEDIKESKEEPAFFEFEFISLVSFLRILLIWDFVKKEKRLKLVYASFSGKMFEATLKAALEFF
jgi:hypothetical protein